MHDTFPNAGEWESYGDDYVCLIRPLDPVNPRDFEIVLARTDATCLERVDCWHAIVFMTDYLDTDVGLRALDDILRARGYKSLDAFATMGAGPSEIVRLPDGRIDKVNSPGYVVDMALAASEVAKYTFEDAPTFVMNPDKAKAWVEDLTDAEVEIFDMGEDRTEPWAKDLRGVRIP